MKLKGIIEEDFVNFKQPAMLLMFPSCSFKCDEENGIQLCQNSELALIPDIEISAINLFNRYKLNLITSSFVFSGLEPFDSEEDLFEIITIIRGYEKCLDPIVIYTGYTEHEIKQFYPWVLKEKNIIIKYGRFRPNQKPHFDEILGVNLISDNQYAKKYN